MNLTATTTIANDATYIAGGGAFFQKFGSAFDLTRCQILKLETRQIYEEPENESFVAMRGGDWELSMSLLAKSRSDDLPLYESLVERGIDFIRCRPIKFPLSDYLRWEMEVLKFNAEHCERVFCCNLDALDFIFLNFARHDFMTFDARVGFIHDYDSAGLIQGGWMVDNQDHILELQKLFVFIKSHCQPLKSFIQ